MTAHIGYDPDRISALARLTMESIDGLARIRSAEPDAEHALRVARAARRTLEDVWMPLLREIEQEIQGAVTTDTLAEFGIEIVDFGIKKLGLPPVVVVSSTMATMP